MANPPLTTSQKKVLMDEGTFRGLRKLVRGHQITDSQARSILTRSYETLLGQLKEAKRELQHIHRALLKMENLIAMGKQSRRPFSNDPVPGDVGVALMAVDGWIVSLMETNLTLTGMLNPAVTRTKIKEFSTAMNALMDKRALLHHPAAKDTELFDGYVNNW